MKQNILQIEKRKTIATRRILLYMGTAYLIFVIYGSLVPLNFRPMSLADALVAFTNIRYLNLGIGSRADWVANILLFMPLAFLWLGFLCPERGIRKRLLASVILWIACLSLSIGIEFTQLFFPPRTVSQNDVIAEGIGSAIGIIIWWIMGSRLLKWFAEWRLTHSTSSMAERVLWVYLILLFCYNLFPLDLTISPVEIYHKWKEGRIIFTPFKSYANWSAYSIYGLITDAAIWFPVAALLVLSRKKTCQEALLWTVMAAISLEGLQLFVYTRVTDITDILTAFIGGGTGVWFGKRLHDKIFTDKGARYLNRLFKLHWIWLGCFLVWIMILFLIFWYPFNFEFRSTFILKRLAMFQRVPFYAYYYGTEYRAITEVLHKVLFFAPLGCALALAFAPIRNSGLIALIICSFIALIIEFGQVALPTKNPDSTDFVLETIGGGLGYWVVGFLGKKLNTENH